MILDYTNYVLNEKVQSLPYDLKNKIYYDKANKTKAWKYTPVYFSKKELNALLGDERNFTNAEWSEFEKHGYPDPTDEDGDFRGLRIVKAGTKAIEIEAFAKGFSLKVGEFKSDFDPESTDTRNLVDVPVFIDKLSEVFDYLKKVK